MITEVEFLVLGAGGLGCPALAGLVAAGARRFTVVDHDRVEASNLQRQTLFRLSDVGMLKVDAIGHHLRRRDPDLEVHTRAIRLDPQALPALLEERPDRVVVLECTDDPELKFLANDVCLERDLDLVIGAALGWTGQALAVGAGAACYRCIFEAPPPAELTPTCSQAGVLGTTTGVLGHWMAALAVRLAAGEADVRGRMLSVDLRDLRFQQLAPPKRPGCPACRGRPPSHVTSFDRACARPNQGA